MADVAEPVRLVVHGHFYQPPRENPWTEEVPVELSAAPAHDWNERITAECYRPNGWARVIDERGRVAGIVNNYEHLSFNVGPTLLSWLAVHHPDVLERMVAADRATGGAIAQGFNHIILPLANERDVRTKVRWGLADFAHRFGRSAAAMWLPETAVSDDVLRVLVEEGVAATILAPGQAAATRPLGRTEAEGHGAPASAWVDVEHRPIATGVPYRWFHPDGRSMAVVFYDGGLSHDLAFALSGLSSQDLVQRVASAAADGTPVVVATDGETFGHHHRWADRSLAYAFDHEAPAKGVQILRLAELLDEVPPTDEVRVKVSAWSCAHGVGRWQEDCGCSTGGEPEWNQAWRAPLRAALDLLRDHGIEVFERRGAKVFADPWAARDAYADVLLGVVEPTAFTKRWAKRNADPVEALTLLEAQRQALLMYTSCGWFFNDLAGIETVQVLRYAARMLDLLAELGENGGNLTARFLEVLGQARSNRPEEGTGIDIWRRHVVPSRVDAGRVVAHLALLDLLEHRSIGMGVVGGHRVASHEQRHRRRGGVVAVAGRVELEHARTTRRTAHVYAAVRLAGLEVVGAVRPAALDPADDEAAFGRLEAATEEGARATTVLRLVADDFGPREFGLDAALPDAAGDIVETAALALADRFGAALERLWDDNRDVLASLTVAGHQLAPELRAPVEFAVGRRLRAALHVIAGEAGEHVDIALGAVREATDAAWEAERFAVADVVAADPRTSDALVDAVLAAVRRALERRGSADALKVVQDTLRLQHPLGLHVDLSRPQELVVDALADEPADDWMRSLAYLVRVAATPGS